MSSIMEQQESNIFLVPLAIVVAGAMIAGAIYMGGFNPPERKLSGDRNAAIKVSDVGAEDHVFGSRNAEVVIIEYSDTECPFCKIFHNTMKQVVDEYEGKVAWVYRHFPIVELHKRAMKEAEATECAAELGGSQAFWKYLDGIFEKTNSNDSLDPGELPKIASEIGLDVETFNSCLESGKFVEKIEKSIQDGINAGARGTPYSVIVSKDGPQAIINGAEPIESIRAKIDFILQ